MIGKVGRAHGLRGAFFVSGREDPVPKAYGEVRIGATPETAVPTRITASHMQGERPVLGCALAASREAAEALTHQLIFVEQERLKRGAAGALTWSDVEGARVVDANGVALGVAHHVYNAGASDVMEVRDPSGAKRVDIPLVPDYVDLARGAADGELRLVVTADVFADLWQDVR